MEIEWTHSMEIDWTHFMEIGWDHMMEIGWLPLMEILHSIEGKGSITIRTTCKQDHINVEVLDSGVGLSSDQISMIEAGNISFGRITGRGLGLCLVRQVVAEHRGRLTISSNPGHGSLFSVQFPRKSVAFRNAASPLFTPFVNG